MKIVKTDFEGLLEIHPDVYEDHRGLLFESYNSKKLEGLGIPNVFPLEIHSQSKKGVIRGLHFQKHPFAQGKLLRVVKGKILDVVVDLRKNSKTYGKWTSFDLSDENKKKIWVPAGFAHGFLALEDNTIVHYKTTNSYQKESEGGLLWNDPLLKIDWQLDNFGIKEPIVSEKDSKLPTFSPHQEYFK